MNDPTTNTDTSEGADEPITLRLRDIANWQLPELAQQKSQERPKRPPAILPGLPSLQRGAVWRPNQIELLWDSVMRGFPIGSMVVCKRLDRQDTRAGAVSGPRKQPVRVITVFDGLVCKLAEGFFASTPRANGSVGSYPPGFTSA
jgi:hypothetical protein